MLLVLPASAILLVVEAIACYQGHPRCRLGISTAAVKNSSYDLRLKDCLASTLHSMNHVKSIDTDLPSNNHIGSLSQ